MTFYIKALIWNRELTILGLVALLGLFAVVAFGARRFIHYLRAKVLWKDQGQAMPLRMQARWPAIAAATGVAAILIIAGLMYVPPPELDLAAGMRVLAATSGVGTGILYFALGRELSLRRLQWAGLAGGLLSRRHLLPAADSGRKLARAGWNLGSYALYLRGPGASAQACGGEVVAWMTTPSWLNSTG
jgi:hypothetical protein